MDKARPMLGRRRLASSTATGFARRSPTLPVIRWLSAATLALAALASSASVAAAADPFPCSYLLNDHPLHLASTPDLAIEVPVGSEVRLDAVGPAALGQVRVDVEFWPLSLTAYRAPFTTDPSWEGSVLLADQGFTWQGLYHILVNEDLDACGTSEGWVRLSDGLPFLTVPGAIGGVAAVGGLLLVIVALRHAVAAGGGLRLATLGGVAAGLGALVVAQQAGLTQIDASSTALWSGGPGFAAMGLTRVVGARRSGAPRPFPPPTASDVVAGATVTAAPDADPPRTSYARLDAPEAVVAEVSFDLVVGLRGDPDPVVGLAPMVRPDWSVGPYFLTIQLLAEGFERLPPVADPWRVELIVSIDEPYPVTNLTLRAVQADRPFRIRQIRALYALNGQALGDASRPIAVVDQPSRLAELEPLPPEPPETLSTPRGEEAPDLTIRLEHAEDEAGGVFTWQMLVRPGLDVTVSSNPLPVDLGSDAQGFVQGLISSVASHEGKPLLSAALLGIGAKISRQVPDEFWRVYAQVAAAVTPRPPSVQILSAESHVPWELALLPDDIALLDPEAPRLLGAQADIGRWVLGRPPPRIPPPGRLIVESMAVISGVYPGPSQLEEAEAEAAALAADFGADPVQADEQSVLDCLSRTPPYQVIHFAVHGSYRGADASTTVATAGSDVSPRILLTDGGVLDEDAVMGRKLTGQPVIFLNACQVGSGHQVLGDYAGLAAAFLYAGASAVIAPMWSIDDAAARAIAHRFYERVFAGASPATAMRLERASFMDSAATASSTFMAYQYYGHPSLKIERAEP